MRLILLRHAKSAWSDPTLDDHDRPLNERGRRSAALMGQWLASRVALDTILVSSARRTLETWYRLGLDGTPEIRPDLYLAPPELTRTILPATGTILLIAHNPGIGTAAEAFAETVPDHPDFLRYPTCACTILDFDGPALWRKGEVVDFAVPRDL